MRVTFDTSLAYSMTRLPDLSHVGGRWESPDLDGIVLSSRNVSEDLHQFLAAHHAGDAEVDEIYAMLVGHAGAAPRFRNQCGSCHGQVATLARGSLVRRGGFLYGRKSNWRLDIFLNGHMGIGEYDVPFYLQLLDIAERDARRP